LDKVKSLEEYGVRKSRKIRGTSNIGGDSGALYPLFSEYLFL
jgi:hypothetical protein